MVTRPIDEAVATAARLEAAGHEAVIEPLLRITPTGAPLPGGRFEGVIVTSANAVAALGRSAGPSSSVLEPNILDLAILGLAILDLPMLAVGRRTAAAARGAGFHDVTFAGRDVEALVATVGAGWASPRRILYLAGTDRSADLRARLSPLGHEVVVAEVYSADKAQRFSAAGIAALASRSIGAVLHFSARTAEAFVTCSRGIVLLEGEGIVHLCLSGRVADILRSAGAARVLVPERPEEDALIALIPR
jgi:uroporphyrinogen-III synthase